MSLPANLMRTNVIADQDMQRVGMVFYLVMPQDTAPPSKPYIIDLLGYNSLSLIWTNFTGSVTIVDVDPQTHLSVGTPNTVSMNGSGEMNAGSSITGVISVSVSSSAVKNSAVTLMALKSQSLSGTVSLQGIAQSGLNANAFTNTLNTANTKQALSPPAGYPSTAQVFLILINLSPSDTIYVGDANNQVIPLSPNQSMALDIQKPQVYFDITSIYWYGATASTDKVGVIYA